MAKGKPISLKEQEKRLTSLVEDSRALGYDRKVIKDFERQLNSVRAELNEIADKRKAFQRAKKIEELKTLKGNLEAENKPENAEEIQRLGKKIAKLEAKGSKKPSKKKVEIKHSGKYPEVQWKKKRGVKK